LASAVLLTYSQFLCAAACSALTASLAGVAVAVIQTVGGFFALGGMPVTPVNIFGLFLNVFGAVLYTFFRYRERAAKVTPVAAAAVSAAVNPVLVFPGVEDWPEGEKPTSRIRRQSLATVQSRVEDMLDVESGQDGLAPPCRERRSSAPEILNATDGAMFQMSF